MHVYSSVITDVTSAIFVAIIIVLVAVHHHTMC